MSIAAILALLRCVELAMWAATPLVCLDRAAFGRLCV